MTKQIPLTQGKFAQVDDADFDWLNQWKWSYNPNGYAVRYDDLGMVNGRRKKRVFLMHRVILGTPKGMRTDHRDCTDRLNNQRYNLRVATAVESQRNRGAKRGSSSKFKGVSWRKNEKTWAVCIKYGEKQKHIGNFKREDDAALAYNFYAHKHFGEFAAFNVAGG